MRQCIVRNDVTTVTSLFKHYRENRLNSTFGQSPVETNAGSDQNAPSHDKCILGEVAERSNALVLKTSKGL